MKNETILKSAIRAAVFSAFAFASHAVCAAEVHPDNWQALCEAASAESPLTIPAGDSYVADETDMQWLKGLAPHSLCIPSGSALVLDDTTTWFSNEDVFASGSLGNIVKRGVSTLCQTTSCASCTGTLVVEAGEFRRGAAAAGFDSVLATGTSAASSGRLVLDGANMDINTGTFTIGTTSSSLKTPCPYVLVTNSTVKSVFEGSINNTDYATGSLIVGWNSGGILEVAGNSVISNRLIVGGVDADTVSSVGAVFQRGGTVMPCDYTGTKADYKSGLGRRGHGYYELSGGTFRPVGDFVVGGTQAGVFAQFGGTSEFVNGSLQVPWSNSGKGIFSVFGGTMTVSKLFVMCGGQVYSYGSLTVQGTNAVVDVTNCLYGRVYCGYANNLNIYFNINDGGTFKYKHFHLNNDEYTNLYPVMINFNRGILETAESNNSYFGGGITHHPMKVVVYEKGAVIATTTSSISRTTKFGIIEGVPKEGGIKAISLPEGGVTGCPAAPYVSISGDGYGATAVALVNPETHVVTNIVMTSSGWGYSADTTVVKLLYKDSYTVKHTFSSSDLTIADNDVGGFTFKGPGTITLWNTNTWEKWTKVLGGKLEQYCEKAIPPHTALTLSNSATLDLANKGATFSGLGGTGGTVQNGSLVLEDGATVSARQAVDGETTAIAGTIDLSGVDTIEVTDGELLDGLDASVKSVCMFSATSIVLPAGGIEVTGLPAGWTASVGSDGMWLARESGLMLILK